MKKLLLAAFIGCTSVAAMAAGTEDSYVAVTLGESRYEASGAHENHTGGTLAFGQSVAENVGYEVGYAHLGKFDAGGSGQAIYLAGVAKYPFGQGFSVHGKIGPTLNHYSGHGAFDSETRLRLLLAAGVGYQFDKNWEATLEYTHFGETLDITPTLWSLGVRYHY